MKNPCVKAFLHKGAKTVKYGKWQYSNKELRFGERLIASYSQGIMYLFTYTLPEVAFEYPTYHAIDKVVQYLSKNNGS